MRYTIKKEFYGAFCYDKVTDMCIAIDKDSVLVLERILNNDASILSDNELRNFLIEEGFIDAQGVPNFTLVSNKYLEKTLSAPGRIHFYYTNRCNLNCKHCFSKNTELFKEPELTYEEKIKMIDEMERLGIAEILVGGGEPFIEDKFCDFIEECLCRNIQVKVFTNGLILDDKLIDRISVWDLRYLSISIDGTNDEEYYKTRGIFGISILKKNIKKLRQKAKYPVAISITVNSYNYRSYQEYLALMKEIGIDRLKIRPTKPSGNVYKNPDIFLSAEQYLFFVKGAYTVWLNTYQKDFKLDCSWGDARLYYDEEHNRIDVIDYAFPYEGFGCFAGKASMVVDANGYVLPCGFLPQKMQRTQEDRFPEKSLKEIWDNGRKFKALRNIIPNQSCPDCKYYGACRGGCIARVLFVGGKINDVDPWCLLKYFPVDLEDI